MIDDDTLEYMIQAGMQRYLKAGKTPEEARKIVEDFLDKPLEFELPSFDEL